MPIPDSLRAKLRLIEGRTPSRVSVLPFGVDAIDTALPDGGLSLGALHEVASGGSIETINGAVGTLFVAGILARTKGQILWCMKHGDLFTPALSRAGLSPARILFVDVADEAKLLACVEEGLRHGGVAAVVGEVSKLPMVASRRLQLAAETTGTLGIILHRWWKQKDAERFDQPTAAVSRWRITPKPSAFLSSNELGRERWTVELLRCRGAESSSVDVEACDEKGYLALPADMAHRPAAASAWQPSAVG